MIQIISYNRVQYKIKLFRRLRPITTVPIRTEKKRNI